MCKKRLFTRNFKVQLRASRKHNFYPCVDEIQASKSTLVHGFIQRDYTPEKIENFNYTWAEKKKRRILKIFSKLATSYGRPLDLPCMTFENTAALNLTFDSFVAINLFWLSFPMLTYPNEEEVGLLDLEASTRNMNSWITFQI